ncbi:MAG: GGDEF domain-containing protein [Saccharofermentans sp.]|nr:GGDEF domain-containing protein [Saccharofermentans sp.]
MSIIKKAKERGVSLKGASRQTLFVSIILTTILIAASVRALFIFGALEKSTDNYIKLEEQANSLMDASDYLTEQVQCYTVINDRVYMDRYFNEAFEVKRRENAILSIEEVMPDSVALYEIKDCMRHSVNLMDREYYAMKLVLEAKGETDIPEVLSSVTLKDEDAKLSSKEKIELASLMVHNTDYYNQKNEIRKNLNECLNELKNSTFDSQRGLESDARRSLIGVMILILVQTVLIISTICINNHLGIKPVLKAVEHIKQDESIPVIGASEFRYLAGAYNVMYNSYRNNISHLNFKASHDELTGAYNRAGYEIIKKSVEMSTTALMIIDADKFKAINDTYGHDIGDKVLKRVANTLKKHFRSDDYVCRIGGDEFVVLMVHIPGNPRALIETKMQRINNDLGERDGDVPAVSLSIGVAYSEEGLDPDVMFRRADAALYYVKQNGRNGCRFYSDELETLASLKLTSISKAD